jgi:Flp pilus assembly protein CpaB
MAEAEKKGFLTGNAWRILILAAILGGIGVVLMNFYVRSNVKKIVKISVATATQQIPGGTIIQRNMLVKQEIPKGAIGGNFVSGDDIITVEGRVVGVDMDPGQPLYWNSIIAPGQGGYDRYLRPENRERAFAIPFSGPLAAAVRPGDVIDILGTYTQGNARQAFEVLPAVTVIDRVGTTLVLGVTADEELLLLAAQPCNPTLSIRSKKEPKDDLRLKPVKLTDVLPKARELGAERTARLRKEEALPAPAATSGSIHRD